MLLFHVSPELNVVRIVDRPHRPGLARSRKWRYLNSKLHQVTSGTVLNEARNAQAA